MKMIKKEMKPLSTMIPKFPMKGMPFEVDVPSEMIEGSSIKRSEKEPLRTN